VIKRRQGRADTDAVMRLVPWLLPAALAAALAPPADGDTWLFRAAGGTLLSAHWAGAFADPAIQVGPLQLVLYGSLGAALAPVVAAGLVFLLVAAGRAAGVAHPLLLTALGVVAVAADLAWSGVDSGHPADTALPLVWILAAVLVRRARVVSGAFLVGASDRLETWGVLGVAVLALAPRRAALRGAVVAAAAAAALFLPFVAFGRFAMGGYVWVVSPHSLLSALVAPGSPVGWPLRLVQGAVAAGAGVAVARAARRSPHAVWLVPGAVVLVRLLLDPLDNDYYFVGLEGAALVGLALVAARALRLERLAGEPALG
jgi:hypothetical protein